MSAMATASSAFAASGEVPVSPPFLPLPNRRGILPPTARVSDCASIPMHRPLAGSHRSLNAQRAAAHGRDNNNCTTPTCPGQKRIDARCRTTAVSRVHPSACAQPSASSHTGDRSPGSIAFNWTHTAGETRPALMPSAVTRRSRSRPFASPRRTSNTTDSSAPPGPQLRSVSIPTRNCVGALLQLPSRTSRPRVAGRVIALPTAKCLRPGEPGRWGAPGWKCPRG